MEIDATKRSKIKRFLADRVMTDAVSEVLIESFLKERKGADVHQLAAARLAIDMLRDGFKDLAKYRNEADDEQKPGANPAV
jgi:hypothetical protein